MKAVLTIRQHPQHLRLSVIAQANRADGVVSPVPISPREHKLRVRVDNRLLEPHDDVVRVAFVILSNEDDPGEVDAEDVTRL